MSIGWLPANFFLLFCAFYRHARKWDLALLFAVIAFGTLLTLGTEILGALHDLDRAGLSLWWMGIFLFLAVYTLKTRALQAVVAAAKRWSPARIPAPVWIVAAMMALLAVIAVASAPNNYDSLAYHLARVMHWLAQRSLDHYPATYLPQLYMTPWAEYAMLNVQAMWGGDRFVQMVQWSSMAGALVAVWFIAGELGASARGAALAVLIAAAIPMGILEATTTQTDYAAASWFVCLIAMLFLWRRSGRSAWLCAAALGASAGLALLTKSTAIPYIPPLALLAIKRLRTFPTQTLGETALALAIAVTINGGHWLRNAEQFGSIQGPPGAIALETNAAMSPRLLASNLIRNLAIEVPCPIPGSARFAYWITLQIHRVIGVDPNDRRSTDGNFQVKKWARNEDYASSPLPWLLLAVAVIITFRRGEKNHLPLLYFLALGLGFLFFCAALKWKIWCTRYHLTLLVSAAPCIGVVLERAVSRAVCNALVIILVISTLPYLFGSDTHSIIGPRSMVTHTHFDQYFQRLNPAIEPEYLQTARLIDGSGYRRIAVWPAPNSPEYLLGVVLADPQGRTPELLNMTNLSDMPARVEALVVLRASAPLAAPDARWAPIFTSSWISLYTPAPLKPLHRDPHQTLIQSSQSHG